MRWITTALVVALLGLAGCGSGNPDGPRGADGSPVGGGAQVGTGEVADYGFSATTLDGTAFKGGSLKGKPAVLWFWAPWCPTCRAQSPTVSHLGEKYAGDVSVVGVGGLDNAGAIADLAARIPNIVHLVDDRGEVWRHFGVTEQSTFTVISADGDIVSEGYLEDDRLTTLVEQLAG